MGMDNLEDLCPVAHGKGDANARAHSSRPLRLHSAQSEQRAAFSERAGLLGGRLPNRGDQIGEK
jgi:hypothetical protein